MMNRIEWTGIALACTALGIGCDNTNVATPFGDSATEGSSATAVDIDSDGETASESDTADTVDSDSQGTVSESATMTDTGEDSSTGDDSDTAPTTGDPTGTGSSTTGSGSESGDATTGPGPDCIEDTDCDAGSICEDSECVPGCTGMQACGDGFPPSGFDGAGSESRNESCGPDASGAKPRPREYKNEKAPSTSVPGGSSYPPPT